MINLITSHSHSNHKWYGKQYLQICIMSIALFPIHVSLLHLISSWSPWHATFTMLNRASSPRIVASKNKVNDTGQWEKELHYSVVCSFAAYEALSINYLAPECKTWLSELHPCWSIFTNINCASPIGLDCISFTNKVTDSGRRGEKRKTYYEQSREHLFFECSYTSRICH